MAPACLAGLACPGDGPLGGAAGRRLLGTHVSIVPVHLLRGALGYDRVLWDGDVARLATIAWTSLRPAA
jgi:hypothetical protein